MNWANLAILSLRLLAAGALYSASAYAAPITIDTVPVGNPGNANDPIFSLGAVSYSYRISTYEVTVGQYVAFLNAVARSERI